MEAELMNNSVFLDLEKTLHQMDAKCSSASAEWKKRSIYKVPPSLKALNNKAYKPQIVSFGPYHHGAEQLLQMEEHKHRALHNFLRNSKKPLNSYVEELKLVVQDLMCSYTSLDLKQWQNKDKFLLLMILDGSFMLEAIRSDHVISSATDKYGEYDVKDPIFSYHGRVYVMPHIKKDMLMLENQLPMLLLEKLITVEGKEEDPETYLNKTILGFFSSSSQKNEKMEKCLHVLDLYRKSLLQGEPPKSRYRPFQLKHSPVHIDKSALQLHEAGIRFTISKTSSFKDISFQGGVLALPPIVVDDATESVLLNLMALELSHADLGNEVTSYVFFMDNIIDSGKDVRLLRSRGIIHIAVGSEKDVANVFNHLAENVTPDPKGSLQEVHEHLNEYCHVKHHAWRAYLIHTYFRNPWAILSLLAAVFLMALTIIQTFFSAYPYLPSTKK